MPEEPTKLKQPESSEGRLLLVSNRLPITIKRSDEGKYDMSMSSGGLVSGLSGLSKTTTFQWYGWPGLEVPEDEIKDLNEAKKEVFSEAKGEGFDVKILKEIIKLRKQDQDERDEHETLLDVYMRAMDEVGPAPVAEAA